MSDIKTIEAQQPCVPEQSSVSPAAPSAKPLVFSGKQTKLYYPQSAEGYGAGCFGKPIEVDVNFRPQPYFGPNW